MTIIAAVSFYITGLLVAWVIFCTIRKIQQRVRNEKFWDGFNLYFEPFICALFWPIALPGIFVFLAVRRLSENLAEIFMER